jgi:hypothetical protein
VVKRARSLASAAASRRLAAALMLGAVWAAAPQASGAAPHPPTPPPHLALSPDLWATVDICNTAAHPRIMGVRASMPGTGHRKERLAMRFRAQFQQADGQWADLPSASSGYRDLGSSRFRVRESGWSFSFLPAPGGQHSVLRGMVDFQWRRHDGRVRYQTQLATTPGHPSGTQGDPPNYSTDTCTLP